MSLANVEYTQTTDLDIKSTTDSKLSNALLESIDLMSNNSVKTSFAKTLTLEAKIVEITDEGRGKYKVQYLDNILNVSSINDSIKYNVGDNVYILVPEGNFDKDIIILSSLATEVSKSSTVEGPLRIDIGDSLYGSLFDTNLCSFREEANLINGNKSFFAKAFAEYLKDNRTFNLSCYIQTNIAANRRAAGNYGLVLSIPVVDVNGFSSDYRVVLDINNIMGDAYNFTAPAYQNLYFTIPEELLFDETNFTNLSLTAFIKDFPTQHPKLPNGEYDEENYPREDYIDVWITKIGVFPTKIVEKEEKEGYYLKLRATEGSLFWDAGSTSKELYPDLYLNGRSTLADPFDCYWFKENYKVSINSEEYNKYGGVGWEILNDKVKVEDNLNGQSGFRYNLSKFKYPVSIDKVRTDLRYKCVLVREQDNLILTDTIVLRNIVDPAELTLTTSRENGSTRYTKGTDLVTLVIKYYDSDISDDASMQYAFKRFNKYNELINDEGKENIFVVDGNANEQVEEDGKIYLVTKVTLPVKEIYDLNTIYCTAYKTRLTEEGDGIEEIIGTASIQITVEETPSYRVVLENTDKVYKYDWDGDSPMIANYDGPSTSKISAITPIVARAYKDTGEEFEEDEYNISTIVWQIPKNSMITITDPDLLNKIKKDSDPNSEYYTIRGNYPQYKSLPYSIVNNFNKSKNNNTIKVNIIMNNISINGLATIKFLKDGESGTNGSKFSAVLVHGTSSEGRAYGELDDEGKICKLQLICVQEGELNTKWYLYNSAKDEYIDYEEVIADSDKIKEWLWFDVKIYCDSDILTESGRQFFTTWTIFDQDNDFANTESPVYMDENILYIKQENKEDPTQGLIKWKPNVTYCATIVSSSLAVKNNDDAPTDGDNQMFEKRIRAYYPIEITFSQSSDIITKKLIPRLDGGFSSVLYNDNFENPEFDSTSNFVFEDRLDELSSKYNVNQYFWEVSESLMMEEIKDKILEKKIQPKFRKFPSNYNCQWVKVQYGYNVDEQTIDGEIEKITKERNKAAALLSFYNELRENLPIIGEFQDKKSNIENIVNSKDIILLKKNDIFNLLNELKLKIDSLCYENTGILSAFGIEKLEGYSEIISSRLLSAVEKIGGINVDFVRDIQPVFIHYGDPTKYFDTDGEIKGIKIQVTDSFFKENVKSKLKEKFIKSINIYNESVDNAYAPYYYEIINENSPYIAASNIFAAVNEILMDYINDLRWGHITIQQKDITIEEETIEIKNPYYNIFYPIYTNIVRIVTPINEYENKLKSIKDINKMLNLIDEQLKLYYDFSVLSQIHLSEKVIEVLEVQLINLINLKNNFIPNLIHIKPIVLLYQTSGAWLDWDGNKIKINDEGAYIAAPTFAAGLYEEGLFTGLTLGVQREPVDKQGVKTLEQRVGMLGHYKGQQSLFVDAKTGEARFGLKSTGQIVIDPKSGSLKIYDSYYQANNGAAGMCLNFGEAQKGTLNRTNPYIHFGDSRGKIYSGAHQTYGDDSVGFYLAHNGFSIGSGVHIESNGNFIFGKKDSNNKYIEWTGSNFNIGPGVAVTASDLKARVGIKCGEPNKGFYNCEIDGREGYIRIGLKSVSNTNIPDYSFTVDKYGNIIAKGTLNCEAGSWIGNWRVVDDTVSKDNNKGALFGYKIQSDSEKPSIKLLPTTSCIAFLNNYVHGSSGSPDYTFFGGSPVGDSASKKKCAQNFVCVYKNNSNYDYGNFRADKIISEYGVLGHDCFILGGHYLDGSGSSQKVYKYKDGTVTDGYVVKDKTAIKINKDGIYKSTESGTWALIVDFNNKRFAT